MAFIDWFAGIGGFRLGLESAGHVCVASCEIDKIANRIRKARWSDERNLGDLAKLKHEDVPDADLWCGGFPCQDVSVAGNRKGIRASRSGLIWTLLDLAAVKKPEWILLENVPGLLSGGEDDFEKNGDGMGDPATGHVSWFGELLGVMADLWPAVGWRVLDAQYVGTCELHGEWMPVPQRRRRVFLVGGPRAESVREVLFESGYGGRHPASGEEAGKIVAGQITQSLGAVGGGNDYDKGAIVRQAISAKWAKGYSGPSGDECHNLIVADPLTAGSNPNSNAPSAPSYTLDATSQHAVAFEPGNLTRRCGSPPNDRVISTLGAEKTSDTFPHVVSTVIRRLSPIETERLQGFPDGFTCVCGVRPDCPDRRIPPWIDPSKFRLGGCGHSICGCKCSDSPRYRMLGNAVAVSVIRWIGERLP